MSAKRQMICQLSYTVPISNIDDVLKNEVGEMQKCSRPSVIRFHTVSELKSPEQNYVRLLQLYLPWRNENE